MNTEKMITQVRNIIANNTSLALTDVYSPSLPLEKENICAVTLLSGNTIDNLCNMDYYNLTMRVLIRGSQNDTTTRKLVDDIFNSLHRQQDVSFTGGKIIFIKCDAPTFVGKDENQRILYNITFNLKGE